MSNLVEIQKILDKQIKRLDDDTLMKTTGEYECARSKALTNSVGAYIKTVKLQLQIGNEADKKNIEKSKLEEELGIK